MISWIYNKIFGTKNERDLKALYPLVEQINSLEPEIKKLSDEQLAAKTGEFKQRLAQGAALDDLLPEAFAVVREVAWRTIGLRPFDVQLMGGLILHQGKIAEMKTGEGKTLVATMPVYLNALTGKGVHLVTVNDYLAKRDAEWMGPVYKFLGLTFGFIQHSMEGSQLHRQAYHCDVTYVTNNELGFDYLRDNMVNRQEDRVLRGFNYAIVDEVDSILIDEARTPLIISGPAEESTDKYYIINRIVPLLKGLFVTENEEIEAKHKGIDLTKGYDFIIDEKAHSATLTAQCVTKCENLLGVKNLYDDIQSEWVHHITQALRAHNLYHRDVDYVVKDGEVIIVDEFTGRLMPGRRWSEGLHQAVEAKEGLRIAEENQTLATITFQNFFRIYKKLGGMTGTAVTEAPEFWQIYKLDVAEMPTNRPMIRTDYPDVIYRTEKEKFQAVVKEIEELWRKGQPVLVGTRSIERSEHLSALLRRKGIPHNVLNAKYHETEAQIIAQAGHKGAVTIATNMAGRGTDIVLGGSPVNPEEAEYVKNAGGLHVLGTERHESRRIDNQLRGRTGRQGDLGSSRFYISLEDELMRLFGSERISGLMAKLGMQDGENIQHPWISRAIENAQRKVEAMNFDIRKQLLDYDNVMNKQREVIYNLRGNILEGEDISENVQGMIEESVNEKIELYAPKNVYPENWDLESLRAWMEKTFALRLEINPEELLSLKQEDLAGLLKEKITTLYHQREEKVSPSLMREMERMIMLQVIDVSWKDNLYDLDQTRKGIGLRAYGQKDPLIEYQHEAYKMFMNLMHRIQEEVLEYLFRIQLPESESGYTQYARRSPAAGTPTRQAAVNFIRQPLETAGQPAKGRQEQPSNKLGKVGRNDPCPCGSGKKYKKCCGK
ncbi:MAG: preprotein translocase subunit SecA [Elusimicrobiota bacterium]